MSIEKYIHIEFICSVLKCAYNLQIWYVCKHNNRYDKHKKQFGANKSRLRKMLERALLVAGANGNRKSDPMKELVDQVLMDGMVIDLVDKTKSYIEPV